MLRPSPRLVTGGLRTPCFRNISIQPTRLVVRESSKSFKLVQSRAYTTPPSGNSETLSWNEFLRLRRQRLICGTLASIPCSILGLTGGVYYFGRTDLDPTQTIMGMDPFIMNTLFIIGCGALGWLVGPSIGRGIWQLFHVRQSRLMTTREDAFFKHIEKHRADPSFQSYSNPVPDYYGEKIGSLQGYRRWLKDQRAYRKKSQNFL